MNPAPRRYQLWHHVSPDVGVGRCSVDQDNGFTLSMDTTRNPVPIDYDVVIEEFRHGDHPIPWLRPGFVNMRVRSSNAFGALSTKYGSWRALNSGPHTGTLHGIWSSLTPDHLEFPAGCSWAEVPMALRQCLPLGLEQA